MTNLDRIDADLALIDNAAKDIEDEGEAPAWSDSHALRLGEAMRNVHSFASAHLADKNPDPAGEERMRQAIREWLEREYPRKADDGDFIDGLAGAALTALVDDGTA